jgi:hypothetical protein
MFSVFDVMFLRPPPFPHPEQIVSITGRHPETNRRVALSLDDGKEIVRDLQSLESIAAHSGRSATLNDAAGVAGRWVETFDVRVEAGRTFYEHELQDRTPVALVNGTLVRTFWPGENLMGRRFTIADDEANPWLTVIGVVPDIRTVKLDESRPTPPTAYIPHRFISTRNDGIVIRTQAAPEAVVPDLRAAIRSVDPGLALFDVYTMEQVRWLSYWMYVMWSRMFGVFGVIALFISAVGVYGVVHYTVAQRTNEIGLRVALGASRSQVVGPMIRRIALLAVIGLTIGLGGSLLVTPLVGSLLIGVSPNDPASFATVSVLLASVSLAATWIPSWRASAVNPVVAAPRRVMKTIGHRGDELR